MRVYDPFDASSGIWAFEQTEGWTGPFAYGSSQLDDTPANVGKGRHRSTFTFGTANFVVEVSGARSWFLSGGHDDFQAHYALAWLGPFQSGAPTQWVALPTGYGKSHNLWWGEPGYSGLVAPSCTHYCVELNEFFDIQNFTHPSNLGFRFKFVRQGGGITAYKYTPSGYVAYRSFEIERPNDPVYFEFASADASSWAAGTTKYDYFDGRAAETVSWGCPLFLYNERAHASGELLLFTHGGAVAQSGCDLHIRGSSSPVIAGLALYETGHAVAQSSLPLYLWSEPWRINAGSPLYEAGYATVQSGCPLYIGAFLAGSGMISLLVGGRASSQGDLPLCVVGMAPLASGGLPFSMTSYAVASGHCPLFSLNVPPPVAPAFTSGILPLAILGLEPLPPGACPILDPLASIQISDELIHTYQSRIDALINQLGKNLILEFDPIRTPCPNCLADSAAGRSTNVYKAGGPAPFARGHKCPYCKGAGFLDTRTTRCIKVLVRWNPRDYAQYGVAANTPRAIVRTKGFLTDAPAIMRASTALMNADISPTMRLRVRRLRGPIPAGLRADRYAVTFWELVDG